VGKRRRSGGAVTTNPGAWAGKSAKKIYEGVLKEVGPAIATVLAATPARCSRSGRSPPLGSFTWYPSPALSFVGLHYR